MAAAVIVRLIPKLHSVASSESDYYIGRQLWFGLVVIYGMVLYVAHVSWINIQEDFICLGNITTPCLTKCFGQSFPIPVLGTWHFFYFIFIALFCLVEVLMAQIWHKQVKAIQSMVSMVSMARDSEKGSVVTVQKASSSWKKSILNFHQEKIFLALYLLYLLLQALFQCVFLFILLFQHRPLVTQGSIHCRTDSCPGPYSCLIRATMEKLMAIYALVTLSVAIIILGTGFFMYSIYHYLLKGHSTSKVQTSRHL